MESSILPGQAPASGGSGPTGRRRSISVVSKDVISFHGGTSGSIPVCSRRGASALPTMSTDPPRWHATPPQRAMVDLGPTGDKAVASVPSAKEIALTRIDLPRAGKCRSSIPGGGSAFEAFCQVKYFLPRSWQLTFASDFAEFARDFSVRIAADWPSALLPFVHIFQFARCCDREREPIESAAMLGD